MMLPDFLQFILIAAGLAFCAASTLFIRSKEHTSQVEKPYDLHQK